MNDVDVFESIKEASKLDERVARSEGADVPAQAMLEATMAQADQPDNRPTPTRTRTRVNPDKQLGVILVGADKSQSYAPLFKSNPEAQKEKERIHVRQMDGFGKPELDQIITRVIKQQKTDLHLYLAEIPQQAFQLTQGLLNKDIIIVASRYMEWESDPKYAWILQDMAEPEGWVIGGKASYDIPIQKFVRVAKKKSS